MTNVRTFDVVIVSLLMCILIVLLLYQFPIKIVVKDSEVRCQPVEIYCNCYCDNNTECQYIEEWSWDYRRYNYSNIWVDTKWTKWKVEEEQE